MKKYYITLIVCFLYAISYAQTKGNFEVYDFDGFRLHVYLTNDVMADASYIIEGDSCLVTMEYPLFKENAIEFGQYIDNLAKPIVHVITDYHEGGSGELPQVLAEGMSDFMKGDVYSRMMDGFKQAFGEAMVSLPTGKIEEIPFDTTRIWAGVPFKFFHGATSDFPAASILIGNKVYYTHWTPSIAHMSHLQLSSRDAVDAELAEAEKSLISGAELFIGGHGGAANKDAVVFKISYLKAIKELLSENTTPESFIDAMQAKYPKLSGSDNLQELANSLYK